MHLPEEESILKMLHDTVFRPSIAANQVLMGEPDLQLIADTGYNATADMPMALYYEKILRDYPDCKFILTTRENSETWLRSFQVLSNSISNRMIIGGIFVPTLHRCGDYLRWLHALISDDTVYFRAFPFPKLPRSAAIKAYEQHNRNVRTTIPHHQLLEYNVQQGWEPLCEFLQIQPSSCPTRPFPVSNSARFMQTQASVAFTSGVAVALSVATWAARSLVWTRRKSKKKG
jgi:hypothetical protein